MIRQIKQEMVDFLDAKLRDNSLAQEAMTRRDARTVFRLAAESCVGIREMTNNAGPMVELIQETLGTAQREPWCMSFVQTCLAYAYRRTGKRSPIYASEHCLTVWDKTPREQRVVEIPAIGAVAIWRHGNSSRGHTGITVSTVSDSQEVNLFPGGWLHMVEANTESGIAGGQVIRDGGGIYRTYRSISGTGDMRMVGFLKPF